jgi:MFS family permease
LITATPLAAEELLGAARWSGLPSALAIMGTAAGSSWLAAVMSRHGRRRGLLLGYFTAATAAVFAALAVGLSSFPLLLASVFTIGAGYGANRLSRYAAADLYQPERQARAIGWVVWAGTIGSVLGPVLLEPTQRATGALSLPAVTGPFLLTSLAMCAAGLVVFVAFPSDVRGRARHTSRALPFTHLRLANARVALVALVIGELVMVLIMTMTPIHVRNEGHGLDTVGLVIAAHTSGMFALSPLSGYLSDRVGRRPMIVIAGVFLVASGLVSSSAGASQGWLALGLFLLGWGWNLGFVSGSALLTEAVPYDERVRLQGFTDTVVWSSAAIAGVSSGLLLHSIGYPALCRLGALVAIVPTALIALGRVALRRA